MSVLAELMAENVSLGSVDGLWPGNLYSQRRVSQAKQRARLNPDKAQGDEAVKDAEDQFELSTISTDAQISIAWKSAKPQLDKAVNDALDWMSQPARGVNQLNRNQVSKLREDYRKAVSAAEIEPSLADIRKQQIDEHRFTPLEQFLGSLEGTLRDYPDISMQR